MSDSKLEIPELPLRGSGVERDGIGEEDHPIPLWFNAAWIASWIAGALYIGWYLGFSDWSSHGQYAAEAAKAPAVAVAAVASENPYKGNAAAIAEGAETFQTICMACHGPDAHGLVGPSLVDPYWKYGNADADHFKTVNEGRPGGMPPWGPQLGAEKIWKVLAYVETLPKSDAPGVGAPGYAAPAAPAAPGSGG